MRKDGLNQSCALTEDQFKIVSDAFWRAFVKKIRDMKRADADILNVAELRSAFNNLLYVPNLRTKFLDSVDSTPGSTDMCSAASDAFQLLNTDEAQFDVLVGEIVDSEIPHVDNWIVNNLYIVPQAKVEWFSDEGLAMTIFQDALILHSITNPTEQLKPSELIGLLHKCLKISKVLIDEAVASKVQDAPPNTLPESLPVVRQYLRSLAAHPIFRNSEISKHPEISDVYKYIKAPHLLKRKSKHSESSTKEKSYVVPILATTTIALGVGLAYVLHTRKRKTLDTPFEEEPRHYVGVYPIVK